MLKRINFDASNDKIWNASKYQVILISYYMYSY